MWAWKVSSAIRAFPRLSAQPLNDSPFRVRAGRRGFARFFVYVHKIGIFFYNSINKIVECLGELGYPDSKRSHGFKGVSAISGSMDGNGAPKSVNFVDVG